MKPKDEQKRQAIFRATLALTGEMGIAGIKMSAIAKRANIGSGTLYVYFQSKEELLNTLYAELKAQSSMSILEDISDLPVKMKLFELWKSSLRYRLEHQDEVVFMEQFAFSPFASEASKKISQQFSDFLFGVLDEGKTQMIIKNTSNDILVALLSGFVRDLALTCDRTGIVVNDQLLQASFGICWDALKS